MKTPNKKKMSYYQSVKFFQLEPYGDVDKDGVPNYLDCRPFDPDKHFLKFSDLKQKFQFGKQKPKKTIQTKLPMPKQVYLYVKSEGKWTKIGQFDKDSNLLRQSVEQLYKEDAIEEHVVTGSPKDERRLNLGEKVTKPIIREVKRAKKHFIETAPKAVREYQKRIGLGETGAEAKTELGRRVREGLEIKPLQLKRPIRAAPEMEEEPEPIEMEIEEPEPIEMEIEEPEPIEMKEREIEITPSEITEIKAPRRGMPPYSRGWAGSIGGSRPYRPVPYKPTGKIWKPERVHNPNPKIPAASIHMWKPPEQIHVSNPKMPVTSFKFMR